MAIQLLVIEDDPQINENLEEILTLKGFQVETALNGMQGIGKALLHPPDLILCDIMMPVIDGYQVLKMVRNNRLTANTPFIFLTAKTESADIRQGMALGADDYLTKPFTYEHLKSAIDSRLQREELRRIALKAQIETFRHNLIAVSGHEYNTPLTSIIGFSSILMTKHQQLSDVDTEMMARMINLSGIRLKRSLDNVQLMNVLQQIDPTHSDYNAYTTGSTTISSLLVADYVLAVEQRQNRQISCQLDVETAQIGLSEANLKTCLDELIDNAFKFSQVDPSVSLLGEIVDAGYRITITSQSQHIKQEDISDTSALQAI